MMTTKKLNKVCTCSYCNKEFYSDRKSTKYCSKECRREGILKATPKVSAECRVCGKSTTVLKNVVTAGLPIYCSTECKKKRHSLECKECGKTFNADRPEIKYCSTSCQIAGSRKVMKSVTCKECGKVFERPSQDVYKGKDVYCSTRCSNRAYSKEHPNRYGTTWSTIRLKALKRDSYRCTICGSSEELQVHHKKKLLSFDTIEEANQLDNLQTLCKTCHSDLHK